MTRGLDFAISRTDFCSLLSCYLLNLLCRGLPIVGRRRSVPLLSSAANIRTYSYVTIGNEMKLIQKNLHAVFELYGNGKVGLLKVRKKACEAKMPSQAFECQAEKLGERLT